MLTTTGLLSLAMAYLIKNCRSTLHEERVSFCVTLGGATLTVLGIHELHKAFTKHYRFTAYYKAVALEHLLERMPTKDA